MDLGSGSTYSENMDAASGGRGGSQNQAPSGFGNGDSGGSNDVYSGYVQASKPRTGIQAIKDYITGDAYDYGYQRSFGKDLTGIGGLLLGLVNPALGLAYKGYQTFKPEFNTLKNSPTIQSYLNNRRNLYAPDTMPKIDNRLLDYYESIYSKPEGIVTLNNPILDNSILTNANRGVYYYPDAPDLNQDQYTLYP